MEVDVNLKVVPHKTDTAIVRPKSRYGRNLLGSLAALGAGIAFGLVLAICFPEGQREGAASVGTSVSDSLTRQNGNLNTNPFGRSLPERASGLGLGNTGDEEDTLRFCELREIRPMVEAFPLQEADAAYARMMSGKAQLRVVLTM